VVSWVAVLFLVILLVLAGFDTLPPILVLLVPSDGFLEIVFEIVLGLVTEVLFGLGPVDGVANVMAGAIFDEVN